MILLFLNPFPEPFISSLRIKHSGFESRIRVFDPGNANENKTGDYKQVNPYYCEIARMKKKLSLKIG